MWLSRVKIPLRVRIKDAMEAATATRGQHDGDDHERQRAEIVSTAATAATQAVAETRQDLNLANQRLSSMDEKLESLRRGYADLTAKAKEDQSRVKAADSAVTQLLTSLKAPSGIFHHSASFFI